jgi:hypothetical protein
MQKLSRISSGQNNKSCGIFHHESNKMVLHFCDFSVIFYAIYKNQPKGFTIWVDLLQGGPREETSFCNVVLGTAGRRGEAKFRRAAAGLGRGRAGEGSRG